MPSPRNQRRTDRPRRGEEEGEGGGVEGVVSPGAPSSSGSGSLSVCPSTAPTLLPGRPTLTSPRTHTQRRRQREQPDPPPPGGGSGGPKPIPPSPGESRRRRRPPAPGAPPLLESGEPAALPPGPSCRQAGWRLPRRRGQAAPALLVPDGGRPAATSCHRLANPPSPPNSLRNGSRPGAPGKAVPTCSGSLRPAAPRPQPLR